jgi:hypothetical protein
VLATSTPAGEQVAMRSVSAVWIQRICAAVFVAGIAGLIVASIAGNNNGVVLTIGSITAIAAIVHITVSTVTASERVEVFDEARAERLEAEVQALVTAGADEPTVRRLVREAMRLGRGSMFGS